MKKEAKRFIDQNEEYSIVVTTMPKSLHAESYRRIPVNLRYLDVDKEPRIIQITSSLPGEHKTTVSANLAATYVEQNKKVILVDCDLRRPKVHRATNLINDIGLANVLADKAKLSEVIQNTEYNFDVITTGEKVPYPHVVLESKKFSDLIEKLKEIYDYVILDSPPVLNVTDSLILSKDTDVVLFIINLKVAKKNEVKEALTQLKNAKANIGGIIMSNVEDKGLKYSYYYGD